MRVETNEDELLILNCLHDKEFKMAIKMTEEEWKQLRFCVLLQELWCICIYSRMNAPAQNKTDLPFIPL